MQRRNFLPSAAYRWRRLKQDFQRCPSCSAIQSLCTHLVHRFRYCKCSRIIEGSLSYETPNVLEIVLVLFLRRLFRRAMAAVSALMEGAGRSG
ncbi:hypothetical protein NPIL_161841 [Nephila pilipes]|uniref:Uncharacterized protein n=1 Tax=Nephila pilipes TaxID=299642 RepID=A0A8X6N1I7_NEPPI|nr:hypothetical protein NPIL_161841 [Nephila pilipes]